MARISDLPNLRFEFAASSQVVTVLLRYDQFRLGACATLDPSFQAKVGDVALPVVERGYLMPPGLVGCVLPRLRLAPPPAGADLVITLEDSSGSATIPLKDLLAPRSVALSPEGPWTFTPGQQIKLRYAPASELAPSGPIDRLVFYYPPPNAAPDAESMPSGDVAVESTLVGDEFTLRVPSKLGEGAIHFRASGMGAQAWPEASMPTTYLPSTRFEQPVVVRTSP